MQDTTLSAFSTAALVAELQKREAVDCTMVPPYEDYTITINGPAILLTVLD